MLHAQSREFRRRVEQSVAIVAAAFEVHADWYVSLSGGKDSTVVLHLVREAQAKTMAQHSERQWMLPETREYLAGIPGLRRIAYEGYDGTDWAKSWATREEAEVAGCVWLDSKAAIKIRGAREGGVFLGLRATENGYRKLHLRTQGPLFRNKATGVWQCNPIAWWTALDVWAYIESRFVEYNRAYDVLQRLGLPLERQRTGPLAVEGALSTGQLATLKAGWPELWNAYAAAHPEARAYA